ncbi:uncharacterized protein LOC110868658 [Helianthus annuus]|uniref:uncharacterized protein LOC110868658 n=1 Tax=Helianthus annuus TaxID=4232 RepID=UPI000B8F15A1|nr:uncharacterized protein LOC110868658 [Helianthus annuus]
MSGHKRLRLSNVGSNVASTSTEPLGLHSYMEDGDCLHVCNFCGALFWLEERVSCRMFTGGFGYNQCCRGGLVALPFPRRPFTSIIHLYKQADFMANIRAYSSMFSMTSFGATIDDNVNHGGGPYVFKISGQIYHWIGSLCPPDSERSRFLQMYIFDPENEIPNRLASFRNENSSPLSANTVALISSVLDSCNELDKLFRKDRDLCCSDGTQMYGICLYGSQNERCYEKPSPGCIGQLSPMLILYAVSLILSYVPRKARHNG